MKTTLKELVTKIVESHNEKNKSFSVYNIFLETRIFVNYVNTFFPLLDNVPVEYIDGIYTQRVSKDDVRNIVEELTSNGYTSKVSTASPGVSYKIYTLTKVPSAPANVSPVVTVTPAGVVTNINSNGVEIIKKGLADYINKISFATTKQIQSRFKQVKGVTCKEIEKIAQDLGYEVDVDEKSPSLSIVYS